MCIHRIHTRLLPEFSERLMFCFYVLVLRLPVDSEVHIQWSLESQLSECYSILTLHTHAE